MNKFTKAAVLSAVLALAGQAAQAQIAPDDLILGFSQTGKSDYVVDLGAFSSLAGLSSGTLSGMVSLTTYNAQAYTSAGVNVAAVGGNNSTLANQGDAYMDALRTGANPAGTVGTEHALNTATRNNIASAGSAVNSINAGVDTDFTTYVGNNPTDDGAAGTFMQALNAQPYGGLTSFSSADVTMDIFKNTRTSSGVTGWAYEGSLTVDMTGTSASLEWTPAIVAVPEPATYGLIAGVGLLALAFRRQFRSANA